MTCPPTRNRGITEKITSLEAATVLAGDAPAETFAALARFAARLARRLRPHPRSGVPASRRRARQAHASRACRTMGRHGQWHWTREATANSRLSLSSKPAGGAQALAGASRARGPARPWARSGRRGGARALESRALEARAGLRASGASRPCAAPPCLRSHMRVLPRGRCGLQEDLQ